MSSQEDLVPTARELGIGFLAYSPLGRGMLTGAYKALNDVPAQQAAFNPRFGEANFDKVVFISPGNASTSAGLLRSSCKLQLFS